MKKLLIFIVFSLIFLVNPQASMAETIRSFDTTILAHQNGVMDITETIKYDFEGAVKHGIYRYIPNYAKVGNLYRIYTISNVKVLMDKSPEPFIRSGNADQTYLKIGDANVTITGLHTYTISYTVANGIGSNFSTHDEIYWNTTGNGWTVPIEKATAQVETDFSSTLNNLICYKGAYKSKEQSCTVSANTAAASNLTPGQGLTIVASYPVGTFPKSILSQNPPQTFAGKVFNFIMANFLYIFIFLNVFVAWVIFYWYLKHKRKERFGKPAVNFDVPKDGSGNIIRPAIAGTIDTSKLERDDVVATVFDLAIRKYIKLEEKKVVRSLLPDTKTQVVTKLKADAVKLEPFEKTLYDKLFETADTVDVSDLKAGFYSTFDNMEKDVFDSLVNKGYYTKNPKYQRGFLLVLCVLSFISLNVVLGILFFYLSRKLNGRTQMGDETDFKIDGLKIFLKSMDRNYKWQAENLLTVEQMIPYAIALGYIDKFMDALKTNYPDYSPTWYAGYSGSFYAAYGGFYSSVSSTFAPASSSGAGGGGFAGGGGGGGGGGSW